MHGSVQIEKRGIALAAGVFAATLTGESGAGGVVYGLGTFVRSEASLTDWFPFLPWAGFTYNFGL